MTVLQVDESVQPFDELIGSLTIDVEVGLAGVVTVVFEVGCQRCRLTNGSDHAGLDPYDVAELVA